MRLSPVAAIVAAFAIVGGSVALAVTVAPEYDGYRIGHVWYHGIGLFVMSHLVVFLAHRWRMMEAAGRRDRVRFAVWVMVLWGAVGLFIDLCLTTFVGDEGTWTHHQALQTTLQGPLVFGVPLMGLFTLLRRVRLRKRTVAT